MNNEFEDEIWESILKAAVIENAVNEMKDYPSDKEINNIVLPEYYDIKIRRLIKRYYYHEKITSLVQYSRKIASIVIIFLGISFAFLLQYDEVRAACHKVIIEIYERYIRFSYTENFSSTESIPEPGYIPNGFFITETSHNQINNFIEYENLEGDTILIYYHTSKLTSDIDNEHYLTSIIEINGVNAIFFESQDKRFDNILLWNTSDTYYRIKSSLGKEELIKIAKNLK